jgi:hypothetical protein
MRYLDTEWSRTGTTRSRFGKQVSFADSNFTNWAKGTAPGLAAVREIADALGVSAVHLLEAMGFLTADEAAGLVPEPLSVTDAIRLDPVLSKGNKAALTQLYETVASADAPPIVDTRRPRRGKPSTKR